MSTHHIRVHKPFWKKKNLNAFQFQSRFEVFSSNVIFLDLKNKYEIWLIFYVQENLHLKKKSLLLRSQRTLSFSPQLMLRNIFK